MHVSEIVGYLEYLQTTMTVTQVTKAISSSAPTAVTATTIVVVSTQNVQEEQDCVPQTNCASVFVQKIDPLRCRTQWLGIDGPGSCHLVWSLCKSWPLCHTMRVYVANLRFSINVCNWLKILRKLLIILPRDAMRKSGLCSCHPMSVSLSLSLSVALVNCIHIGEDIVKLLVPPGSTIILVFLTPCTDIQFQGDPFTGTQNTRFSTDITVYLGNGTRLTHGC